ncbi:IS110 family transposase [Fusobacterium varium]
MIFVCIDIASKKHDCCIISDVASFKPFIFSFLNNLKGFNTLLDNIFSVVSSADEVKVGLEPTGHYGINIENSLRNNGFALCVFNPIMAACFKKAQTLRKTKTDKIDTRILAQMTMLDSSSTYVPVSNEIRELKSLTRNRFRMINQLSKLKISIKLSFLNCLS